MLYQIIVAVAVRYANAQVRHQTHHIYLARIMEVWPHADLGKFRGTGIGLAIASGATTLATFGIAKRHVTRCRSWNIVFPLSILSR